MGRAEIYCRWGKTELKSFSDFQTEEWFNKTVVLRPARKIQNNTKTSVLDS
jgi:hypothetical protein